MISLYQAPMSSCTQKVRFVLEQKELPWEGISVDLHSAENYSAEFRKINPKAIIPALDDDGDIIIESNNICLYLDEKYPQTPLMPTSAKGRSDVRVMIQLMHNDASVCTYAMAFRERIRNTYDTDEKLDAYLADMPDAGRRYTKQQVIVDGTDSAEFIIAVKRLDAMLALLEQRLQNVDYLVENKLSIADIIYSPYLTRLDHLNMQYMWADRANVSAWYKRIQNEKGYQRGLKDFFIEDAINNMRTEGGKWQDKIQSILAKT